jgi:cysteinyl-tRNA synthetase
MIMRTLLEPSGGGLKAEDPAKNTFDIHGGGIDLVFPHHENEIAQSCCAFGPPGLGQPLMANVWMHNGFLQVEGTKMSKSLGNFTTIRDLLDDWPGEVLRLTMLKTHYRQPIDWTERGMAESRATLDQWYAATDGVAAQAPSPAVLAALADDLATPKAIAELHALRSEPGVLRGTLELMGFLGDSAANWAGRRRGNAVDAAAVEALIANRLAARRAKDWALSDRLRIEIEALGVKLKDGKDPTTGEPVTTWEAVS